MRRQRRLAGDSVHDAAEIALSVERRTRSEENLQVLQIAGVYLDRCEAVRCVDDLRQTEAVEVDIRRVTADEEPVAARIGAVGFRCGARCVLQCLVQSLRVLLEKLRRGDGLNGEGL